MSKENTKDLKISLSVLSVILVLLTLMDQWVILVAMDCSNGGAI